MSLSSYGQSNSAEFIKGVDVSALLEIEDNGGVFKATGMQKDALQIFKENGINYCRLRLWHTPTSAYNNLTKTLLLAKRIKEKGLKLMLDFHYSDTWADPGNQKKPLAWENLPYEILKDSLYNYTKSVMTAFKNQNTVPSIVQIGNEIICGMLWNECRVCESYNTTSQWTKFSEILKEGIKAVKESTEAKDSVKIMIHIDRGGDNSSSRWFYDKLSSLKVDFDIIGLSYYPWWHGTLTNLKSNMDDLASRYGKDIIVVETAYPWTLGWNDNTNNIVGNTSQTHSGYPATVDGQKKFLSDIIMQIGNTINNKGAGLFYWAPDWISTKSLGSPWENLALFDFNGEVLNSITAFGKPTNIDSPEVIADTFELYQNYPNPFNPSTRISYELNSASYVVMKIYNSLGEVVKNYLPTFKDQGVHYLEWDGKDEFGNRLSSGVYIYTLLSGGYFQSRKMILLN